MVAARIVLTSSLHMKRWCARLACTWVGGVAAAGVSTSIAYILLLIRLNTEKTFEHRRQRFRLRFGYSSLASACCGTC